MTEPGAHPGPTRRAVPASLRGATLLAGLGLLVAFTTAAPAADLDDAEALLRAGKYDECARMAGEEITRGAWLERWRTLKIEAELARGKTAEATATLEDTLRRFPTSVAVRLLGREVYRAAGREDDAEALLDTVERLVLGAPQRYTSAEGRVALGRFFLLRGADARKVLDQFYDVAAKQRPDYLPAYLATAELALGKQDDALAATTLRKAPADAAADPRYHYLLARAFADEDRAESEKALDAALKLNPKHVDSLLLRADQLIDSEKYAEAEQTLGQALEVNATEPRAWAYRAVLAHLKDDPAGEDAARKTALAKWPKNPEVEHLIGRKLSQKYRFAEGSACQKRALEADPNYLPAKIQLCQDWLRLGDEAEGWSLAADIFARDPYNVVAFNLTTLRDRIKGFRTIEEDGFVVRMDPREADLYGARVIDLLKRARKTLAAKYEAVLPDPVIVEIFPQRREFAVRTFGLPGAAGLLGVCFGRVVTANSPASQGEDPSNWEAVLWHEFCHVVTLSKTHNKMPRWLSEGISVYEEKQADPAWATPLDPRFRAMILGKDFTPLSQLSSAFLAPASARHLQFAYFESSLAVEFLVERSGLPALKGVLDDLGAGQTLNEALPRRTGTTLEVLDGDFARFARGRAERTAPEATWDEPDLPPTADSAALSAWLQDHPKSFAGTRRLAARLVTEEAWEKAKEAIETLRALDPGYVGPENAYMLRAAVARKTADPAAERQALEALAARDAGAGAALLRLLELDGAAGDWSAQARDARRLLAVNPLTAVPHRALARAAEHLGDVGEAIAGYRALAVADATDPAEVHYRLASLLKRDGKPDEARRQVLRSLEEAPRFRESLKLLLELTEAEAPRPATPRPEGPTP